MSEIDYEARVAKGIALLDKEMPDWAAQIRLSQLDIGSVSYCVTAQLSGEDDYRVGLEMLDLEEGPHNDGSYTQHGFQVEDHDAPGMPDDYDEESEQRGFDALNRIWRREVAARQEAAQPPA